MKIAASIVTLLTLTSLPATAEVSYRNDIVPMLKAQCLRCHDDASPPLVQFKTDEAAYKSEVRGPRLSSYMDLTALIVWPDTGALMRRLDDGRHTADNKPGNMYRYLGQNEAERQANLSLIKAWVGEKAWNLNRWNKRGVVPAITKEQLDELRLSY